MDDITRWVLACSSYYRVDREFRSYLRKHFNISSGYEFAEVIVIGGGEKY